MRLFLLSLYPLLSLAQCTTLVCESFDTYSGNLVKGYYGPSNLSVSVGSGALINATVDPNFFYSAPSSLHFTCPTNTTGTGTLYTKNAAVGDGWPQVYGRAMIYFSNASGARLPTSVHSWVFAASGTNDYYATHNDTGANATSPNGNVNMNIIVGNPRIALNYHWGPSEQGVTSSKSIQPNQWFCMQWHYDGPNSGAKVWVDGEIWINVTHDNSFTNYTPKSASNWRFANQPGWRQLQFGYNHYQVLASPVDYHLDDVVLDTQMTCCPCAKGANGSYCCPEHSSAPTPANGTHSPNSTVDQPSNGVALAASVLLLSSLMIIVF